MAWFKNRYGNPLVWETQITEGGGPITSPRINRGKYDHRKAQRGQNAYGGGGVRVLSDVDDATKVDVADIDERINAFKSRNVPVAAVKSAGLAAIVYGLIRRFRR